MNIRFFLLIILFSTINLYGQIELRSKSGVPAYSSPQYLTAFNQFMFFRANNEFGNEPWVTDGTQNGTFMLKDIANGKLSSNPGRFHELNGKYFFVANDSVKTNVYITDGTTLGTSIFLHFHDTVNQRYLYNSFIKVDDKLYFNALNDSNGMQLWETDGTEINTNRITNFKGSSWNYFIGKINDEYVFLHGDSSTGVELWKSKGSEYTATLIKDINPGKSSTQINFLGQINNSILFTALDSSNDRELWITDATSNGTHLLKNISINTSSGIQSPKILNNNLLFSAYNDTNLAIWISDATEKGTKQYLSTRINESLNDYHISNNDIFASVNSNLGTELYMKVGDSLQFFRDLIPGNASSFPIKFINLNDSLVVFSATKPNSTSNIWIINKNSKSVQMPFDLNTDLYSGSGFANFKNKLFFGMYNFNFNGSSIYYISPSNSSVNTYKFSPVLIYPNPSSDFIIIQNKQPIKNIHIYNQLGQLVLDRVMDDTTTVELDIQHLDSGVYLIKIEDVNGRVYWEKFIHQTTL